MVHPGALAAPAVSGFGFIYVTGPKLLGIVGTHTVSVEDRSGTNLTVPNSVAPAGFQFPAQGFCAGFSPNGRTSNSLSQSIVI